ncbi:hypothetical protein VOLCADRAFT_99803 [Volvox carteri f. nagariensis]|uniref:Uncharacterized protein n=1 Tax=Volvox carteri f. nagariensis TaxID=3068 RepID=D8UIP4_VOLCA|nr:uncharacterized protein VOLCADRAFT_99803 [Volvox carteri f. nagariensis]EFJ40376.1 hypothetical protein VOLCADRAFT_99803 [Volvox carteri f. nagariensis]|eukprot:XP_002958527.1 hypothetical protein VOLCADRAFT_99803 [Volvox carteri f. nagariensis]
MEWINEQLQRLHVEAAAKEAKLDDLEKELCKKPEDHVLRGKHARLVENLADLNARQKNLEEKLAAAAMGGSGVVAAAATDGSGVVSVTCECPIINIAAPKHALFRNLNLRIRHTAAA